MNLEDYVLARLKSSEKTKENVAETDDPFTYVQFAPEITVQLHDKD